MRGNKQRKGKGVTQGWSIQRGNKTVQALWPANPGKIGPADLTRVALLWGPDEAGVVYDATVSVGWDPTWGWGFRARSSKGMAHYLLAETMGRWILSDSGLFIPAAEAEQIGGDIVTAVFDLGAVRSVA